MERDTALDVALGQIDKQFGKGSVMRMGDRPSMGIKSIPTGAMALDLALGVGGLPRGRVVEIYGPESSGKSTLAMHVVAEAQRNGGICAYIDAEHAMDPVYAAAIGVNIDDLLISQPDTGEQALEISDMLIRSGALDVLVIDSVAALTPRAEIEGEMGDTHVGLQARLMSQALRKLTGTLNRSDTIAIFINQLREKIGVVYGCLSWGTLVTLADGTQEHIGKIVDQKLPVEVLSYDPALDAIVPKNVVNWFDNGPTEEFLHFSVPRRAGRGTQPGFACTSNHKVRTPGGWREAGELAVGDQVLQAVPHHLSEFQWEALRGGLMGEGALSYGQGGFAARYRFRHGPRQAAYADWKASLWADIEVSRFTRPDGVVTFDFTPLAELEPVRHAVYVDGKDGKKVFDEDYLKRLTPLSLAIWYMDDGSFSLRAKGLQERTEERTEDGGGRSEICMEAMDPATRVRVATYLADVWGIRPSLISKRGKAFLVFTKDETAKLHAMIAPFVHPSMEYKLLPRYRGRFAVEPVFTTMSHRLMAMPIKAIRVVKPTRRRHRYDIEVEGSHNYFAGGVMVHNSPEVTPGGRALKFYASVRLDIRRIESIKDGGEVVGSRTRVKVVKNKCVAAGTTVFDPTTGLTHRIEDIVEKGAGSSVVAADKLGQLHARPIVGRMDQGEHEVIGLHLRDGTALWLTADHRVLTDRGWVQAGELDTTDRVARPRTAPGFGDHQPVSPAAARMLGQSLAEADVDGVIPAAFFSPDVSSKVVGNLLSGLFESDGWVSREQPGGLRAGFCTTSEQLAQQVRWLLLRWGIASSVKAYDPKSKRPSVIGGRMVHGKLPCWEVRVSGSDNIVAFAGAVPMWGPRGQKLTEELAQPEPGEHRCSPRGYLPAAQAEPVLAYLRGLGLTPRAASQLLGEGTGRAGGSLRAVLGHPRLRRDRLERLADALDSEFLRGVLAEDLWYDRIVAVSPSEWRPIYDVEVDELHTFVANDIVVSNCAPPFKQCEFDIGFGKGISREGSLIDVGASVGIVKKSGAWYTYEGEQLGQGRENAKQFLIEHPEIMVELDDRIRRQVGLIPGEPGEAADDALGQPGDDDPILIND